MEMRRPIFEIALFLGISAGVLGCLALGYHFAKLPESAYASKVWVKGFSEVDSTKYASFEAWDAAVKAWLEQRLAEPILLTSERGDAQASLAMLGVEPDWALLNPELKEFMEESGAMERIRAYFLGTIIDIQALINEERLEQALASYGLEQGEKNASFSFENGVLAITPQQTAYGIQREPLRAFLEESLSTSMPMGTFALTLRAKEPKVTDQALELLLPTVSALEPLTVTLKDEYGITWDLGIADFAPWIIPAWESELPPSTPPWTLEESAFMDYAETKIAPKVESEPQPVVISENVDGTYTFEGSARFGVKLDTLALRESVTRALTSGQVEKPLLLPTFKTQPSVTVPDALKNRGVTDLVGLGSSDFSGSPSNRIHNIERGIGLYNGILIEQGAEFSFMEVMPEVDASNGFLPELVIKGDETIPEYGGGLCQISSTMFRAVLYSGLPVTERKNHSYAVSYYARPLGYGLDATIYDPAPDLKFVNDTPGDVLVQAYTEDSKAYYVFYGTHDGRTVTMDGPYSYDYRSIPASVTEFTNELAPGERQLDAYGHMGFTTDWFRTVFYPSVTEEDLLEDPTLYVSPYAASASGVTETIHSVYEARPAKYLEGRALEESLPE
jgi:vancomycin resistance protein YoaR